MYIVDMDVQEYNLLFTYVDQGILTAKHKCLKSYLVFYILIVLYTVLMGI